MQSQRCSLSSLLLNTILEILVRVIRKEKGIKAIQTRKDVKLSLLANYIVLYFENSKFFPQKAANTNKEENGG